jgi:hypothetical protein
VSLDNFLADGESNPCSFVFLARVETLKKDEDLVGMLGSDPDAVCLEWKTAKIPAAAPPPAECVAFPLRGT